MKSIFTIAFLIAYSLSSTCDKGCAMCDIEGCDLCHNSMITPQRRCQPSPPPPNCIATGIGLPFGTGCSRCRQGYAADLVTGKCKIGTRTDCAFELAYDNITLCNDCTGGKTPVQPENKCTGQVIDNCLEGGTNGAREPICHHCVEGMTSFNGVCKPTPASLEGCNYTTDGQKCDQCDYLRGYWMPEPTGECIKE